MEWDVGAGRGSAGQVEYLTVAAGVEARTNPVEPDADAHDREVGRPSSTPSSTVSTVEPFTRTS